MVKKRVKSTKNSSLLIKTKNPVLKMHKNINPIIKIQF